MRKKSGKKAAQKFKEKLASIETFATEVDASNLGEQAVSLTYEIAVIKTAVAFEHLMLDCLITAINNDTRTISERTGISFPKHLTDQVCEYLVTGGAFFDFKGRDGLLRTIKSYVPADHWLVDAIKQPQHTKPLNRLIALRNFAAHESPASKHKLLEAIGQSKVGGSGSWVKCQGRFLALTGQLRELANDIEKKAPF